jgi:hypothetical protein
LDRTNSSRESGTIKINLFGDATAVK